MREYEHLPHLVYRWSQIFLPHFKTAYCWTSSFPNFFFFSNSWKVIDSIDLHFYVLYNHLLMLHWARDYFVYKSYRHQPVAQEPYLVVAYNCEGIQCSNKVIKKYSDYI